MLVLRRQINQWKSTDSKNTPKHIWIYGEKHVQISIVGKYSKCSLCDISITTNLFRKTNKARCPL